MECHQGEHRMTKGHFYKDYGWQEKAIEKFQSEIGTFYSTLPGRFDRAFVAQVSPSGGKTIFSMKLASRLISDGHIDKVIFVVPRNSIKLGFEDDQKQVPVAEHARLIGADHLRIEMDLKSNYSGALNNYHGAVVTYHALPGLLGYFKLLSDAGRRLMFVFDEAHHGASGDEVEPEDDTAANVWGEAMSEIGDFACSIVAMTGTPVRSDKKTIPHFIYEEQTIIEPEQSKVLSGLIVKADFVFSYKDAVEAGVARKLIIRNFDATITADCDGEEVTAKLSGLTKARAAKTKNILVRCDAQNIDPLLREAYNESQRSRKCGDDDAAVLVVVDSTRKGGPNPLEFVAERIKALFGEVAVTVESADGPEAAAQIRKFKKSTARWIVAKNMISEGTNIPRVRTVCILRSIKSQVFYEQLVHRATRNDSNEVPQDAIVIQWQLPDLHLYGCVIEEQTRLVILKSKLTCPGCAAALEYRPSYERPCGECGYVPDVSCFPPKSDDDFVPLYAELDGEEVRQGGEDFSKYDPMSRCIFDRLGPNPRYGGRDGINEILRLADTGDFMKPNAEPTTKPLFDPDEQIQRCWDRGRANIKSAAGIVSRARSLPYDEVVRDLTASCKRQAGMKGDIKTVRREHKTPVEVMQKFLKASEAVLSSASRGTSGRVA